MRIIETDERAVAEERRVLIGLVTNQELLAKVSEVWPQDRSSSGLFGHPYADLIAGWCVKHFKEHKTAPDRAVESYFEKWATKVRDPADVKLVEKFLAYLSEEHDRNQPLDTSLLISLANDHFNRVKANGLKEFIDKGASNGRLSDALDLIEGFSRIDLKGGNCTSADKIELKLLRWLWEPWFAYGEMTLLDGLPGQGKSLLTIDLAARITRGWVEPLAPEGEKGRKPANVVLVTVEDSWEHTILPRLMAAGADLSRVFKADKEPIAFPRDVRHVEAVIRQTHAKLLIVDPIMAAVGDTKTDTNAESHVRHFLQPLMEMVRRTKVAAVLVRHFKKEGASAIHRGMGSQAWTAVSRLQHVVGTVENKGSMVILAASKSNLAPKPASLGFNIEQKAVADVVKGKRLRIETARIEWVSEVDVTANEVAALQRQGRSSSKHAEAVALIRELLGDGPKDSAELQHEVMSELGISERTFKDARKAAGVEVDKKGFGMDGKWSCKLP